MYLHEALSVVEDREEGALSEVAAGSSEVGLPHTQGGVQGPQALLHLHVNITSQQPQRDQVTHTLTASQYMS